MGRLPRMKSIEVNFTVPVLGGVKGTWEPNTEQREAAWELYIELVTRISVTKLTDGHGLLREALDSLHSLFNTTRAILRQHGPEVAKARGSADYSLGKIAVTVLNYQLRPLLSEWHPRLLDYESKREPGVSAKEHEGRWEDDRMLRRKLDEARVTLVTFANLLAKAADVPPLHDPDPSAAGR